MAESTQKYAPLSDSTRLKLALYEALMGRRPDGEIARAAGIDRRYVVVYRHYAGIPPYQRSVRDQPTGDGPAAARTTFRRSRLDDYQHLMGEVPDGRIAELAGCSREAVMRYRSRHNIGPASRAAPSPAPAVSAMPTEEAAPNSDGAVVSGLSMAESAWTSDPVADDLPPEVDEVLADPVPVGTEVRKRPSGVRPAARGSRRHGYLVTALIEGERQSWLVIGSDIALAASQALRLLGGISPGATVLELRYHAEML